MTNRTVRDLEDLVYRMISFMEDTIISEKNPVAKGQRIFMQKAFIDQFSDVLDKKKEIDTKRREEVFDEDNAYLINIVMPKSEEAKEELKDELFIDIPNKKTKTKVMEGGNPKKSVMINLDDNVEYEPEIEEPKIKESKKQKINRKLNILKADDVKKIGGKFNIKPEQGKKYLTKNHVISKIKNNTKLYTKVLKHINTNFEDLRSESTDS